MNNYIFDAIGRCVPKRTQCKYRKDGEHVLAMNHLYGPMVISLNKTSAEILDLCDGKNTIENIYQVFVEKYDEVNPEQLKRDVCVCVRNLEYMNLVTTIEFEEAVN